MSKFRIVPHGSFGLWWKVQKRHFGFLWVTVKSYFDSAEQARKAIEVMKEDL